MGWTAGSRWCVRLEAAFVLALGCAAPVADTDPPERCDGDPSVEIGTGITAFEPLEELAELEIVFGQQGGYHLPGAVRTCNLADGMHEIHFVAVDEESGLVVTDVRYARLTRPDGRCCAYVADIVGYLYVPGETYLDPSEFLDGNVVALTMTITDPEGHVATGSLRIVARDPHVR